MLAGVFLAASLLVAALPVTTAHAQDDATGSSGTPSGTPGDATVSVQQLDDLVSTLEDPDERAAFIERLKALIAAQQDLSGGAAPSAAGDDGEMGLIDDIAADFLSLEKEIEVLLRNIDDGSDTAAWLTHQVDDPDLRDQWLTALWKLAAVIVAGLVGAMIPWLLLRGARSRIERHEKVAWPERLFMAFIRCVIRLAPIAGFAAAAHGLMYLLDLAHLPQQVATFVVNAVIVAQVLLVVARCLLSPLLGNIRPLPIADEPAAYLYVWSARFIAVAVYGFYFADLLVDLGLPESGFGLIVRILGLVLASMAFIVVMQVRKPVAHRIRGHPNTGRAQMARNRLADIWHVFAGLMVILVYVVWALDLDEGFSFLLRGIVVSVVVFFAALLISVGLRYLLSRIFDIGSDFQARFPGLKRRSNRYIAGFGWLLSALTWLVAAIIILEAWQIDILSLLTTPQGADLIGRLVSIAFVILIALVVWELGDGALTTYVTPENGEKASPRLVTLLPLLSNVLLVAICIITVITILSELGVEIGPLLAGAGVIGLAVGFGSQALVRDVISGTFILFEDQMQVGDYVEAGGKMGTVEGLSIRSVTLRDLDGNVHIVPFGEVTSVTNMTRDYGYAVIDVGVAYQENTDRVLEVVKDVDREAREDAELAKKLIGALEVFGVNSLDDSAVTLRVRIKTLAGFQWGVRREYLRRIKLRFDREGIEIPFPHLTLYFGEVRQGPTSPAHVRIDTQSGQLEVPDDARILDGERQGEQKNLHLPGDT